MTHPGGWIGCAMAMLLVSRAVALDIVITNDDGFEASTIHALYQTLRAEGHRVIISSETQDNSGKGGAADFFKPIGNLTQESRGGHIKVGAPGVGTLPDDNNVFYVDGTPLAAAIYAIDIAAPQLWHKPPDLVVSGPNYGNNTGLINNSSGTVNAALISINRGVPAIAVSTAVPKVYKSFDKLTPTDPEWEVADLVLKIVRLLASRSTSGQPLLPPGIALNVNLPTFTPGSLSQTAIKLSREGTATAVIPVFVLDLSQDATVHAFGLNSLPPLPGLSASSDPIKYHLVRDTDPLSEQNVIAAGNVSVSVIQGNHQSTAGRSAAVGHLLRPLFVKRATTAAK